MLERQDGRRDAFFRLKTLTDLSASRLAPSGPRPNALPLHNVRDRKTGNNGGGQTSSSPAVSAFFTPSAFALDKTDESHRKDRSATPRPNLARPLSRPHGLDLGGARRDRTDDLMLAKHALSQLSYGPVSRPAGAQKLWWAWEDLNLRPHAYQARALTN